MPNVSSSPDLDLNDRIDALARGTCTEDEFLLSTLGETSAQEDSPWTLLSLIDQRYRRGELSLALFNSLKLRIARQAVHGGSSPASLPSQAVAWDRRANANTNTGAGNNISTSTNSSTSTSTSTNPSTTTNPSTSTGNNISTSTSMRFQRRAAGPSPALESRYRLLALSGEARHHDVFQATDSKSPQHAGPERLLALKVTRPAPRGDLPADRRRLRQEFEALQQLSHPSIPRVYECSEDEHRTWFTQEYVEGRTLRSLLEHAGGRALPIEDAWSLIGAVGSALSHAHRRGLTHGGLSADAVVILKNGEIRVLGFGSPLDEGRSADWRDDLRALACLAYEMLTGRRPFEGQTAAEASEARQPPTLHRPESLNSTQWDALRCALSSTPERRGGPLRDWLSAMGVALEPCGLASATDGLQPPRSAAGPTWRSAYPGWMAAALLGALAAWLYHGQGTFPAVTPPPRPPIEAPISDTAGAAAPVSTAATASMGAAATGPAVTGPTAAHPADAAPKAAEPTGTGPAASGQAPTAGALASTAAGTRAATGPRATALAATGPAAAAPPPAATVSAIAGPQPVASTGAAAPARTSATATATATATVATLPAPRVAATRDGRFPRPAVEFSPAAYAASPRAHFVEARLHRSRPLDESAEFVWWTEDGTAVAGRDYLAQPRSSLAFSRGQQNTALFVRLQPSSGKTRTIGFRVCAALVHPAVPGNAAVCAAVSLRADHP